MKISSLKPTRHRPENFSGVCKGGDWGLDWGPTLGRNECRHYVGQELSFTKKIKEFITGKLQSFLHFRELVRHLHGKAAISLEN